MKPSVKVAAYTTLARPILEYANVVWDPHQQYLIDSIEMVQWRAAGGPNKITDKQVVYLK